MSICTTVGYDSRNNLRKGDKVRFLFRKTWYYGVIDHFSDTGVFATVRWDFDPTLGTCEDRVHTSDLERV